MKQINYFKFLEKFPEFIDIDESDIVKFTLLAMLKKMYWRKKENEKDIRLLPISYANVSKNPEYYREKGLDKFNYIIVFRKYKLFAMYIEEITNINTYSGTISIPFVHFRPFAKDPVPWKSSYPGAPSYVYAPIRYMSKEEIKNWKRTILIDSMLK